MEQNFGSVKVDVHETDNEIVATCDIPGPERKENVDITIDNSGISISGTVNQTHEVNDENIYRRERFLGRFHR